MCVDQGGGCLSERGAKWLMKRAPSTLAWPLPLPPHSKWYKVPSSTRSVFWSVTLEKWGRPRGRHTVTEHQRHLTACFLTWENVSSKRALCPPTQNDKRGRCPPANVVFADRESNPAKCSETEHWAEKGNWAIERDDHHNSWGKHYPSWQDG